MAEALPRHLAGDRVAAFRAGTEVTVVRPEVLAVLQKHNIDAIGLYSKHRDQFLGQDFDYVRTYKIGPDFREEGKMVSSGQLVVALFPGGPKRIHWRRPDPSAVTGE